MKKERIIKFIVLLTSYILTTQLSIANPILFSGKNLSGRSVVFQETSAYNNGASPNIADYIYFSPPKSYYAYSPSPGKIDLHGANGKIVNKSLYVPQCWRTFLRVIPKDQLNLRVGYLRLDVIDYFPFISYGFFPGVTEFAIHSAEDQFIGYVTQKDPSCVPTHAPLIITGPRYEFFRCKNYTPSGTISWNRLQGNIKYTLQERLGSKWKTVYSGLNTSTGYTRSWGKRALRVRASAEGINGPWAKFGALLPECLVGTEPIY